MRTYPSPRSSAELITPRRTIRVDQHDARDWTVVMVDGEMDLQVLPLLPDLLGVVAPHVAVTLDRVTFMDASALGALVRMQREALSAGGCARLVSPSRAVRRLLLLTGTRSVFGVYDRLEDAMAAPVPSDLERVGLPSRRLRAVGSS